MGERHTYMFRKGLKWTPLKEAKSEETEQENQLMQS
jgi:hypothetical protein